MKRILPVIFLVTGLFSTAQNVGIGTSSPTGPLSFNNVLGNKIVLWGDGNTAHYGLGIQSGLLQLYTDLPGSSIVFGYGRSGSFTERMRVNNGGGDGMFLNGRMHIKNGTNPLDINYGGGVWLYKADNSALLGFMGTQNNQNIGFYGGPAGWGFTYDAINSRVGIGNANPNAPLAFPPVLGKKITLYPGATGDVGLGVAGNRLQIYSDNPNADVAIGYDASGTFNERFAFKPNGALALNGNSGQSGQVLMSNGPGSPASWSGQGNAFYQFLSTDYRIDLNATTPSANLAGINGQSITLSRTSAVIISCRVLVLNIDNTFGGLGSPYLEIGLLDAGNNLLGRDASGQRIGNGEIDNVYIQFLVDNLPPGTFTISAVIKKGTGDDLGTGYYYTGFFNTSNGNMIVQVIPK